MRVGSGRTVDNAWNTEYRRYCLLLFLLLLPDLFHHWIMPGTQNTGDIACYYFYHCFIFSVSNNFRLMEKLPRTLHKISAYCFTQIANMLTFYLVCSVMILLYL